MVTSVARMENVHQAIAMAGPETLVMGPELGVGTASGASSTRIARRINTARTTTSAPRGLPMVSAQANTLNATGVLASAANVGSERKMSLAPRIQTASITTAQAIFCSQKSTAMDGVSTEPTALLPTIELYKHCQVLKVYYTQK